VFLRLELTSHIPDRGTQLVHYYGAYSNAHRGIALRREVFIEVPPEDKPSDPPRKLPGWSPPLSDQFCPGPFPRAYGSQ